MSNFMELIPEDIALIESNLPPEIAILKDEFPGFIYDVAEYLNIPPYPDNYVPEMVDIYYAEGQDGPSVSIENGVITHYEVVRKATSRDTILVEIDDCVAFVQIRNKVLLDRRGGAILPEILMGDPEKMLRTIISHMPPVQLD